MNFRLRVLAVSVILLCLSCADNSNEVVAIESEFIDTVAIEMPLFDTLQSSNFKVVLFDVNQSNELFRVFIQTDMNQLNNKDSLYNMICELSDFYALDSSAYISFFTEQKYANYKEELFTSDSLDQLVYEKWRNNYYVGEFEFSTREFIKYPASPNLDGRMVHMLITPCN
ncbi:hypothetical protein N8987_03565 [Crocinitomix sp.]|nr:hypothetical protein [Crocinitomix sp.]